MKHVLVTGCGRGMGLEVLKNHVLRGDFVFALTHSMTDELKDFCQGKSNVEILVCELTDDESVEKSMEAVKNGLCGSRLDFIYNVAGIYRVSQNCGIEDTSMDECMLMYNVNALGPMRILKWSKKLELIGEGCVVMNVSSEAGSIGQSSRPGEYGYCMSKAALNMVTKNFSNQLKKDGLSARVFCMHPGWLRTQMGGEDAKDSPYSISAKEAADSAMKITLNPSDYSSEQMFFDYKENILPW